MSIIALRKQIELLIKKLEVNDWFPEEEGYLGMSPAFLRKLRTDPAHYEGWRYRPSALAVDKNNKVVRRGIIWNKTYLLGMHVQA